MIKLLMLDANGNTVLNSFANGVTTKVEPDGRGGLLQVVRDIQGRIIAGPVAGLVLKVLKEATA